MNYSYFLLSFLSDKIIHLFLIFLKIFCCYQVGSILILIFNSQKQLKIIQNSKPNTKVSIKMESEVFCPICSKQYKDNNLPRILTMCGHTYCQVCISKMITKNISEQQADEGHPFLIECPQDGAKLRLTINQLNLFPKNLALLKVIQSKKSNSSFKDESFDISKIVKQEQIQEDDQTTQLISAMKQGEKNDQIDKNNHDEIPANSLTSVTETHQKTSNLTIEKSQKQIKKQIQSEKKQQDQLCLLHQKPLQIICIIDRQKICSKCAIFGEHKGHQFKSVQQVQKQRTECYEQILQIFKQKQEAELRMSSEDAQSGLIQILNRKRDFLEKQVRDQYRKLRQQITKQQKIVLKRLNETYKSTQTKIKGLLKVQQKTLKDFSNWEVQSFEFLKILEDSELQNRIDALYSRQQRNTKIIQKGKEILSQIGLQQGSLVGKVEQILIHLECRKSKKIFQCIPDFIEIFDKPQQKVPDLKLIVPHQKSRNMTVSTLIIQNLQNQGRQKTDGSNCTIFDAFNQKNNYIEGSPLLQESLLDVEQTSNLGGSSSESSQNIINTFNYQLQTRIPLRPKQNCINKNIQQDSVSCSFNRLELQSAKKFPQKTAHKIRNDQQSDFFQNQRSSILLTGRQSIMTKNLNGQKPTKKKLKGIKISQKYQKMLQGIYNNTIDTIDLTNAQVGDSIMLQICQFVKHSKARTIKFIRNKLTDNGVQKLLPMLGNAQILNLSQNNLTQAVLDMLIKHRYGYLSGLKNVILSQNKIIQRKHKNKIDQLRAMNVLVSV